MLNNQTNLVKKKFKDKEKPQKYLEKRIKLSSLNLNNELSENNSNEQNNQINSATPKKREVKANSKVSNAQPNTQLLKETTHTVKQIFKIEKILFTNNEFSEKNSNEQNNQINSATLKKREVKANSKVSNAQPNTQLSKEMAHAVKSTRKNLALDELIKNWQKIEEVSKDALKDKLSSKRWQKKTPEEFVKICNWILKNNENFYQLKSSGVSFSLLLTCVSQRKNSSVQIDKIFELLTNPIDIKKINSLGIEIKKLLTCVCHSSNPSKELKDIVNYISGQGGNEVLQNLNNLGIEIKKFLPLLSYSTKPYEVVHELFAIIRNNFAKITSDITLQDITLQKLLEISIQDQSKRNKILEKLFLKKYIHTVSKYKIFTEYSDDNNSDKNPIVVNEDSASDNHCDDSVKYGYSNNSLNNEDSVVENRTLVNKFICVWDKKSKEHSNEYDSMEANNPNNNEESGKFENLSLNSINPNANANNNACDKENDCFSLYSITSNMYNNNNNDDDVNLRGAPTLQEVEY